MRVSRQLFWGIAVCAVLVGGSLLLLSMRYAAGKLDRLRHQPAYASAEGGIRDILLRRFPGGRVEIVGAGNEAPGMRFVVARVWPAHTDPRASGKDGGREEVGWSFLRMEHGWVWMRGEDELSAPVIALGKMLIDWLPGGSRMRPASGMPRAPAR
jgi:hypothetical protein